MSVKFLVDSAADLTLDEAKELGVTHLPLRYCSAKRNIWMA